MCFINLCILCACTQEILAMVRMSVLCQTAQQVNDQLTDDGRHQDVLCRVQ